MQPKSPPNPIRRQLLTSITSLLGFVGVIFAAIPFLSAFKPSARAEAAGAPVKVNISKLSPGELMTVEWRGMPVFVYKVSSEAQNALSADKSKLADPNSDQQQQPEYAQNDTRSRKKGIAVVKGVCTHLGCAPKFYPEATSQDFDPNWQGGFSVHAMDQNLISLEEFMPMYLPQPTLKSHLIILRPILRW